jgi:hypothetical protein
MTLAPDTAEPAQRERIYHITSAELAEMLASEPAGE